MQTATATVSAAVTIAHKIAKIEARKLAAETNAREFSELAEILESKGKPSHNARSAEIECEGNANAYAWALAILRNG